MNSVRLSVRRLLGLEMSHLGPRDKNRAYSKKLQQGVAFNLMLLSVGLPISWAYRTQYLHVSDEPYTQPDDVVDYKIKRKEIQMARDIINEKRKVIGKAEYKFSPIKD
jgi:hypothetical protein